MKQFNLYFFGFLLLVAVASCARTPGVPDQELALDPAFGLRGVAVAADADAVGGGDLAYGLALDAAGGVRLYGRGCTAALPDCTSSDRWTAAVWAFTPEGAPDPGFGTQGVFNTDALAGGGPPNLFFDSAWRGRSLVFVGGGLDASGDLEAVLLALEPDASPDPALFTGGLAVVGDLVEAGSHDFAGALLDAGDRFWLAGGVFAPSVGAYRAAVFRVLDDGTPDPGFGGGVFVDTGMSDVAWINDLAPAPDGGVLAGGSGGSQPVLWRVRAAGGLEVGFGDAGRKELPIPAGYDRGEVLQVAALEGGFLAAGYVSDGSESRLALWRLGLEGVLEPGFGEGGAAVLAPDSPTVSYTHPIGLALDADGRIWVAGGLRSDRGDLDMAVWRLLPDGTPDPHFCGGGPCAFDNAAGGSGDDWGTTIAFGADGAVYVGGESWNGTDLDAVVWKFELVDAAP